MTVCIKLVPLKIQIQGQELTVAHSPTTTYTQAGQLKSICTGAQLATDLKMSIGQLHFFGKGAQAFMK